MSLFALMIALFFRYLTAENADCAPFIEDQLPDLIKMRRNK